MKIIQTAIVFTLADAGARRLHRGRYLEKVFTDKEEVLSVVEKAILLFREQGITGERFADICCKNWI